MNLSERSTSRVCHVFTLVFQLLLFPSPTILLIFHHKLVKLVNDDVKMLQNGEILPKLNHEASAKLRKTH